MWVQHGKECPRGHNSEVGRVRKDMKGFVNWDWVGTRWGVGASGDLAFVIQGSLHLADFTEHCVCAKH